MPLTTYILILICLIVAEALYLRVARRRGIVSLQGARSSHSRPTVVGGGVVYYVAVVLFYLCSGMTYPWLLAGATLLAAVSFADDLHPLGIGTRMAVQFAAVACMCCEVAGAGALPWWWAAVAAICAVGFINAWNFMDGINGLNGAYTALALATLLYIDAHGGNFVDPALPVAGLMASAVFCACNFRRRPLCFAGDVGSVTAAVLVLYPLSRLIIATGSLMWLGLVAVYGVDAVLTIIRRLALGHNIFHAHRMHLYQLLANEGGLGHLRVATLYVAVQAAINAGLLLGACNPYIYIGMVLTALTAAYFLLIARIKK